MLIDQFLPRYHHNEIHGRIVGAPIEATYDAARDLDFSSSWVIRALFALRRIKVPERTLNGMLASGGFAVIAEDPPNAFVVGLKSSGLWSVPVTAEDFSDPVGSGILVAFDFRLREGVGHTEVITETRILCNGRLTRILFGAYWAAVRPFSGLVRLEMLRCLDRQARQLS